MTWPYCSKIVILSVLMGACGDVESPIGQHGHGEHQHDILPTTVVLNFRSLSGNTSRAYKWSLLNGDTFPYIEEIILDEAVERYVLSVEVWNEDTDISVELTGGVLTDGTEHQVFFTGSAIDGPSVESNDDAILRHSYADMDDNGLPIGIENEIQVLESGKGELRVLLRHLPSENGKAIKVKGLATVVATSGFDAIGGDVEIDVSFPVIVALKKDGLP